MRLRGVFCICAIEKTSLTAGADMQFLGTVQSPVIPEVSYPFRTSFSEAKGSYIGWSSEEMSCIRTPQERFLFMVRK